MLPQMSNLNRVLYTDPPDFCEPSMNAPNQAAPAEPLKSPQEPAAEPSLSGDIVREVAALAAERASASQRRRRLLFWSAASADPAEAN